MYPCLGLASYRVVWIRPSGRATTYSPETKPWGTISVSSHQYLQLSHLIVLTLSHFKVCLSLPASNSVLIRERREYLLLDRGRYRSGSQGAYQHNLRELSSFNQMAPWQSYQLYSFSGPKRKWSWGYLEDH